MDPLDREKPWGIAGQLLVIVSVVGLIYLVIRFAAVVPEWGWQVVLPVTLVATVLYYLLAFRFGFGRKPAPPEPDIPGRAALRAFTLVMLTLTLLFPLALALWYLYTGKPFLPTGR